MLCQEASGIALTLHAWLASALLLRSCLQVLLHCSLLTHGKAGEHASCTWRPCKRP